MLCSTFIGVFKPDRLIKKRPFDEILTQNLWKHGPVECLSICPWIDDKASWTSKNTGSESFICWKEADWAEVGCETTPVPVEDLKF